MEITSPPRGVPPLLVCFDSLDSRHCKPLRDAIETRLTCASVVFGAYVQMGRSFLSVSQTIRHKTLLFQYNIAL